MSKETEIMETIIPETARTMEIGDSLIRISKFVCRPPSKSMIRIATEAKNGATSIKKDDLIKPSIGPSNKPSNKSQRMSGIIVL